NSSSDIGPRTGGRREHMLALVVPVTSNFCVGAWAYSELSWSLFKMSTNSVSLTFQTTRPTLFTSTVGSTGLPNRFSVMPDQSKVRSVLGATSWMVGVTLLKKV